MKVVFKNYANFWKNRIEDIYTEYLAFPRESLWEKWRGVGIFIQRFFEENFYLLSKCLEIDSRLWVLVITRFIESSIEKDNLNNETLQQFKGFTEENEILRKEISSLKELFHVEKNSQISFANNYSPSRATKLWFKV